MSGDGSALMELRPHPAADSFPMFDAKRFAELCDDIKANGQREPITLCDGLILDGRNRYKACVKLGIKPLTRTFEGNPWTFAWSLNGARRDLVDEQRFLIWKHCTEHSEEWGRAHAEIREAGNAKRSNATKARERKADGTLARGPVVQQSVAPLGRHKAQAAKATASRTNPGAVARGEKLAKERPDLAAKVRKGELKPAEAHRQMRKQAVAAKVADLPVGRFSVLYADPPWKYGDGRTGDRMTATGALHHYATMTLAELKVLADTKGRTVHDLSAQNSVLFLWATSPLLPDALELAKAWGFTYKASFVWDKVKHNLGHYNSVRHELLLICTRGLGTPEKPKLFDSVQSIERSGHSAKPEEFRKIIETLYPSGRKLELFRRGATPKGWQAWGNEHG